MRKWWRRHAAKWERAETERAKKRVDIDKANQILKSLRDFRNSYTLRDKYFRLLLDEGAFPRGIEESDLDDHNTLEEKLRQIASGKA